MTELNGVVGRRSTHAPYYGDAPGSIPTDLWKYRRCRWLLFSGVFAEDGVGDVYGEDGEEHEAFG